jgi:hypothetical protein
LNNQKVALRWLKDYPTEAYLTPDGYRDFEIRPAVDLNIVGNPESNPDMLKYKYNITSFTEDEMQLQILFENPESISALGLSSDSLSVTFWSSNLLQAKNGLNMAEGQTIAKNLIPQIEPKMME